jgi:glyoxylase-like metal-dependent hydrolase (beta-lactamase superfamily II)
MTPEGRTLDDEIVDRESGVALRRVVVGPLATNCWIVHAPDERAALVVDPGDEPDRVLAACRGLDVTAVVLTHAHWDHVLGLPAVSSALRVPVLAHPAEAAVWAGECHHLRRHGHWDAGTATADLLATDPAALTPPPDRHLWDGATRPLRDGEQLHVGPLTVTARHTPGHTPGGLTLELPGHLLTGDTLFPGGPGLTGAQWPDSDFPTILRSVERLLTAPGATVVHPGHGRDTTVAHERPGLPGWRTRGW